MRKLFIAVVLVLIFGCDLLVGPAGPQGPEGVQGEQGPPGVLIERLTHQIVAGDKAQTNGIATFTHFEFFLAGNLIKMYLLYPPTHPTHPNVWMPGDKYIVSVADGRIRIDTSELPLASVLYFYNMTIPE